MVISHTDVKGLSRADIRGKEEVLLPEYMFYSILTIINILWV